MVNSDIDFFSPCSSYQAKFDSLSELRKHLCGLSQDGNIQSPISPVKTKLNTPDFHTSQKSKGKEDHKTTQTSLVKKNFQNKAKYDEFANVELFESKI